MRMASEPEAKELSIVSLLVILLMILTVVKVILLKNFEWFWRWGRLSRGRFS